MREARSLFKRFILGSGNVFFRFRNFIFPIVIIALMLFTRPALFMRNPALDRAVMVLGLLVTLSGQTLRFLVMGAVRIRRSGKNRTIHAKSLVTDGIYAHTRNPLYVANLLMILGLGMIYGAPEFFWTVVPFFIFVYSSIVLAEEQYLKERFGSQYEQYFQTVNRFVPDLRGIHDSLREFHFNPKRILKKEHTSAYETLIGICCIYLWKTYYLYGLDGRVRQFLVILIVMIILTLLLLIVKWMKAKRMLA